jgi:hypothetical protein
LFHSSTIEATFPNEKRKTEKGKPNGILVAFAGAVSAKPTTTVDRRNDN